ncbi:MAG: hypothetical protein QXQ94_08865 [Candidatus Bathyarchaeia archaeon]
MPRQRLAGKVGVSLHLWVPLDLAEAAKRLCVSRGTSLSAVVTEFLKRWVGEAGEAGEWAEDYEFLKREYRRLFREFERLHAQMRKEDPEDELLNLAVEQGLDTEKLANMDEVVAKLLTAYDGPLEKLHLFIDFLEAAKRLCEKQEKLTNTRKQKYPPPKQQEQTTIKRY